MLRLYAQLLRLYPSPYRQQFEDEMLSVFHELRSENTIHTRCRRGIFYVREIAGVLRGAARERCRTLRGKDLGLFEGGFMMRDGFRFPKATAVLMTLILAGIVIAIQKGEAIQASLPASNPQIGPIQPHSVMLSSIVSFLLIFYAAGSIGWIILLALRKLRVHRLDESSR
ncbi:MAG TPA: hypothetical protein VF123_03870 [Candidatus Sulfotelmatobacter sp.]